MLLNSIKQPKSEICLMLFCTDINTWHTQHGHSLKVLQSWSRSKLLQRAGRSAGCTMNHEDSLICCEDFNTLVMLRIQHKHQLWSICGKTWHVTFGTDRPLPFGEKTLLWKRKWEISLSHDPSGCMNPDPICCLQQLLDQPWRVLKNCAVSRNSPQSLSSV